MFSSQRCFTNFLYVSTVNARILTASFGRALVKYVSSFVTADRLLIICLQSLTPYIYIGGGFDSLCGAFVSFSCVSSLSFSSERGLNRFCVLVGGEFGLLGALFGLSLFRFFFTCCHWFFCMDFKLVEPSSWSLKSMSEILLFVSELKFNAVGFETWRVRILIYWLTMESRGFDRFVEQVLGVAVVVVAESEYIFVMSFVEMRLWVCTLTVDIAFDYCY